MRHDLSTEIHIDAPPLVVWDHLTDLDAYEEWNPFITSASGPTELGGRLRLRIEPPGGRPMTFRPTVTELVPARTLDWLGRVGVRGLLDGRHRFELVPVDGGTRLVHSERFTGVLVPMARRSLDGPTRTGLQAMNAALVQRITHRPDGPQGVGANLRRGASPPRAPGRDHGSW